MMLTPDRIGELSAGDDFFAATGALGTKGYYARAWWES